MKLLDNINDWLIVRSERKHNNLRGNTKCFKSTNGISWNIYQNQKESLTKGDNLKKYQWLHYVFKLPIKKGLLLVNKIANKYLVRKVIKTPYNINFVVFEKSFDKAIDDWSEIYIANRHSWVGNKHTKETIENFKKGDSVKTLRVCKDIMVTMCLEDTAYREFFNILMFEMMNGMNKEYKNERINHLLYTDIDTKDIHYYGITKSFVDKNKKPIIGEFKRVH